MVDQQTELVDERPFGCYLARLSTSTDKLKLYLSLSHIPENAEPIPTIATIQAAILQFAPNAIISKENSEYIARCIKANEDFEDILISSGVAPIDGRNGRIVFLVKPFDPPKAGDRIDRIDHRFIRRFDNIEPNAVVLRRYPPENGTDGVDVLGNIIPAKNGEISELKFDSNLTLVESANTSYEELIANVAGYLDTEKGAFTIKQHLTIDGDIDQRTGDVEFVGSVTVNGSVMKDFSVIARYDIKISSDVVSGTVISHSGSIFVAGNIGGNSKDQSASERASSGALKRRAAKKRPLIRAKKDIQAMSIEDSDVEAGGNIEVTNDVRNSYIRTHGILSIKAGSLIGGSTYSVKGVEAAVVGSSHGTDTKIFISDDIKASAAYSSLQEKISKHKAAERMLKLYLGPYRHEEIDLEKLDKTFSERIIELRNKLEQTQLDLKALELFAENMLAMRAEIATFQLNFVKFFYCGSKIEANETFFSIEKDLVGPKSIIYNATSDMFGILELRPLQSETKEE